MAGESTAAGRRFLDHTDARGLRPPPLVTVDGGPGLEAAVTSLRGESLPIQRCTLHKHRNPLAHAPQSLHDELDGDYRDMIHAPTGSDVQERPTAFLGQWRSSGAPSPIALQKPVSGCSAASIYIRPCGKRCVPPMPLNRTTGSCAAGSKPGPSSPVPRPCPCSSGHCRHQGKIQMRKVDGWAHSATPSSPSPLTWLPDSATTTSLGEQPSGNPHHLRDTANLQGGACIPGQPRSSCASAPWSGLW